MPCTLTRHIQDVAKLDTFARQLERKNSTYFKDAYDDAVSRKYGYLFCDLHPHSDLRDGPHKIKYRSLVHKAEGQILYMSNGGRFVVNSPLNEDHESSKHLLPASFNHVDAKPQILSTEDIPIYKPHQPRYQENMPHFPQSPSTSYPLFKKRGESVNTQLHAQDCASDSDEEANEGYIHYEDVHSSQETDEVETDDEGDSEGNECSDEEDDKEIRTLGWMYSLSRKPGGEQVELLKNCSWDFIQDLHNLIDFVAHDKNIKIPGKYMVFLKKHRTFLYNFVEEDNYKKKKDKLTRKAKGGFLGVLIPILILLATER